MKVTEINLKWFSSFGWIKYSVSFRFIRHALYNIFRPDVTTCPVQSDP